MICQSSFRETSGYRKRSEGRGKISSISPSGFLPSIFALTTRPHPPNENTAPLSPEIDPHWTHNPAYVHEPQVWDIGRNP